MNKLIFFFILFLLSPIALVSADRDFQTGFEIKGFNADQPYAGSQDAGHVNLYSGSLVKTQSLINLEGRGLSVNLQATYNSNIYGSIDFSNYDFPPSKEFLLKPGAMGYGWTLSMGRIITPNYYKCGLNENFREYTIEFPDGSSTKFAIADESKYQDYYVTENGYRVDVIKPGLNAGVLGDDTGLEIFIVTDKSGTQYYYTHHVYPSVPVNIGQPTYDCRAIDPITQQANPYSDNAIKDVVGSTYVQNHLSGVYLTRIQDVHGNYVTIDYHDQNQRSQNNNWAGCNLGCGISWGSPYIYQITDTLHRKITFGLTTNNVYDWQKMYDWISYRDAKGNLQYLDFIYGFPSANPQTGEGGITTIKDCASLFTITGVCNPRSFLREIKILNGSLTGEELLPSWKFDYDKETGELTKLHLSTGGSVEYQYRNLEAWYYDVYTTNGEPRSVKRRVVDSITKEDNNDNLVTKYYYRENKNAGSQDTFRRETWIVHPKTEDNKTTVEMYEYISLNPFSYYLDVMGFKNGLEIKNQIFEFEGTYEPVSYDSNPGNGLFIWTGYQNNLISTKTKFYTTRKIGNHEIYNLYHPVFGPEVHGIPDLTIPNKKVDFLVSELQGELTTLDEGGVEKSTYVSYEYDDFGNIKKSIDYGYVIDVIKGDDLSSPISVCDKNNINKLNGLSTNTITHNCYFQGTPIVNDETSTANDYVESRTQYLHEVDNFYLGSQGDGECATSCDPLASFRNKHFQIVNLPKKIDIYALNGEIIASTKYSYDELNNQPHSIDNQINNYDSDSKLTNHRHVAFQQGTIINTQEQSCLVKQGYLNKIEEYIITPETEKWIIKEENIYDTSGNLIKKILPTGLETAYGYDDPADLNVEKISNTCQSIPPKQNWPWGNLDMCEADAIIPPPLGLNKYFRAYPTEIKNLEFSINNDYNYYTGSQKFQELNYDGDIKTADYQRDELDRIISVKRNQDINTPMQKIEYYDFELPQKIVVSKKLKEAKILIIDADGVDHNNLQYLSQSWQWKVLLEQLGYAVDFYSYDEIGNFNGINNYEQYTLVIWEQGIRNDFSYSTGAGLLFSNQEFLNYYNSGGKFWLSGYEITEYLTYGALKNNANLRCYGDCGGSIYFDPYLQEYLQLEGIENGLFDGLEDRNFYQSDSPDELKNHNGKTMIQAVRYEYGFEMDRHDVLVLSPDNKFIYSSISPWSFLRTSGNRELFVETLTNFLNVKGFQSPIHYFYDGLGRNYATAYEDPQDGGWIMSTKEYDKKDGSVKKESKPFKVNDYHCSILGSCVLGVISSIPEDLSGINYVRDGIKRITKIISEGVDVDDESAIQYFYGADYIRIVDKKGNSQVQTLDSKGNIIKEEYYEGNTIKKTITRSYDIYGNLVSVSYEGDELSSFKKDNRGLIYEIKTQDTKINNRYDDFGRQIIQTNPEGQTKITSSYDALGRLNYKTIAGRGEIYFDYDGEKNFGKLTSVNNQNFVYDINYDIDGKINSITQNFICPNYLDSTSEFCDPVTLTYEYFGNDQTKSISINGQKINYGIDLIGRINQLVLDDESIAKLSYTPSGKVSEINYANEYSQVYDYYDRENDLLKSIKLVGKDSYGYPVFLNGKELEYDYNSNIVKESEINQDLRTCYFSGIPISECPETKQLSAEYEYDNYNQLIEVVNHGEYYSDYSYEIDSLGRINSATENGITENYLYSGYKTAPTKFNGINLEYDKAGRLKHKKYPLNKYNNNAPDWEFMNLQGNAQGTLTTSYLKVESQEPSIGLYRVDLPVEYGKTYKIKVDFKTGLSQGEAIVSTGCHNVEGDYLGPLCGLDNFNTSRKTGGFTDWKTHTWFVNANHPTERDLVLTFYCYMAPPTYGVKGVGYIACKDLEISQANEYYEYDAENLMTELTYEDNNCQHFIYDHLGRRIYEDNSITGEVTRYIYDGKVLIQEIKDYSNVDFCEYPIVNPPPPEPKKKLKVNIQEVTP